MIIYPKMSLFAEMYESIIGKLGTVESIDGKFKTVFESINGK